MIGIGIGPSFVATRPITWSPILLSGIGPSLVPKVQREAGLLWQDTGKTVAAYADGDPVRVATCPFTHTDIIAASDAARPLLKITGSKAYLLFDGSSDYMSATVASGFMSAAYTLALGIRFAAPGVGDQIAMEAGVPLSDGKLRSVWIDNSTDSVSFNGYNVHRRGSVQPNNSSDYRTIIHGSLGTGTVNIYVNGTDAGSGALTNSLVSQDGTTLWYGGRVASALFCPCRIYAGVAVNAEVTASERSLLDAYLQSQLP